MPHFYKVPAFKVSILLYLLFQSAPASAQRNFSIGHYTAENGLPQNSVKSIAADADGFIWLATEDGLTRFDGRNFKVYDKSSTGADTKRVTAILPGKRDRLHRNRLNVAYAWFSGDQMASVTSGNPSPVGTELAEREQRWAALRAEKKDIYFINGVPERWSRVMLPHLPTMITNNYAEGNFFLCDQLVVTYYQHWEEQYKIENEVPERLNYFTIGNKLYYLTRTGSFVGIFGNQRITFPMKGALAQSRAINTKEPKLYWNNNSDQAFLYVDGQLFELVQELDGTLTTILLTNGFDLAAESIDVIHYDRDSKKLFLGSSTNGLFVIALPRFENIRVNGTDRPNIFYAQIPYDSNSILTPTGIIAGKNPETNRKIEGKLRELEQVNPSDRRVIFRDRAGSIWVKSGWTLRRLDKANQVTYEWKFPDDVKAFCQTSASEYWIAVAGKGLYKLDLEAPSSLPGLLESNLTKQTTCLSVASANQVWAGTENGLYLIDTKNGRANPVQSTKGLYIKSIQRHDQDRIWVTAADKGLMLIDGRMNVITFPLDKRNFLASAHCALDDGNGYLWLPTNRGLFQIKIADLLAYAGAASNKPAPYYGYHSMDEGFANNEFNGGCSPCGVKLPNGYVSFPSMDGLVWFKPEQIRPSVPDGRIILDGAFLNRAKINASGDTVHLPLKPENIRFDFSTAYFGNNDNLHVSYALIEEGSDEAAPSWQPIEDDKEIAVRYSSLSSGKYRLLIRKEAGFGLGNVVVKEIHIVVPEHWYETGWAMLAFITGSVLLLTWGVQRYNRYRLKSIQSEKAALERLVGIRTSALQTTLTDLDEQVHIMSRMLASISHDVQTPLNQIAVASEDIPDLVRESRFEDVSKVATMIAAVSGRTGKMLTDLLNYIKIQVYGKRLHFETIALHDLISEKIELFEGAVRRQENTVTVDVPRKLTVQSDSQLLSIVIHNLLDNAVKYTRRGRIAFHVHASGDRTELVLANSGKSLPREKMEFMNSASADKSLSAAMQHERGSSLGLIIVKEVSHLIGIKIYVTQTETVNFHLLFDHLK